MVTLEHDSASSRKQPVAARPEAECTARIEDNASDRGGERAVESPAPLCVARLRGPEARHRFHHARYLLALDPGHAGGGSVLRAARSWQSSRPRSTGSSLPGRRRAGRPQWVPGKEKPAAAWEIA